MSSSNCGCDTDNDHTCNECQVKALQNRLSELARDRQWLCDTIKWFVNKEKS